MTGRVGGKQATVQMGVTITCIDYASQSLTMGDLHWLSLNFGENLNLGDILRVALSGRNKIERSLCAIAQLSESYDWVLQGCPRGRPSLSRVPTAGMQL